jgi:hypothetical protein
MHLQPLEDLAAILHRDVDLERHHLEVGRRGRAVAAIDGRLDAPLDELVADLPRSRVSNACAPGACTQRNQIVLPHAPSLSARILIAGLSQSSACACSAHAAWSSAGSWPFGAQCATRTTQHSVPPLRK